MHSYYDFGKNNSTSITILNIDISDFNNIDLDEENYKSTYKMQKVDQLRKSSDTLVKQFQEDKLTFSESFLNGHTLRKLPNLRPDQVDELEIDGNTSFINIEEDPQSSE